MTSVGIDIRNLYLVYMAKVLDDNLTTADYMIGNHAYIQSFVRLRGGSRRKRKTPIYDSDNDNDNDLAIDTPDVSENLTHLPRSNYVRAAVRRRRNEDLNLGSTSTQTEFMPVSYYVEPRAVVGVSVPPSLMSNATPATDSSSGNIMSRLPDRTRVHRNVTPARRCESSIFSNTTDNIDNIMRRLSSTPVDMSRI